MQIGNILPSMPNVKGLYGEVQKIARTPKATGYFSKPRGPSTFKLSDEQVIEIRTKSEKRGYSSEMLCSEYNLTQKYMYSLLTYATRSKLYPKMS